MTHFTLDESLGYLINRTARRLKHELDQVFKANGYDITPEQWTLLNRLWQQEGLSQVELAEQTFKDKPNVTRILDILERKLLLFRQKDENDRRAFKVYLTEAGRELKEKLIPLALEVLERGQKDLTDDDIAFLQEKLNTIYHNFE
ncbi:MAG: MarR family transcriptional regulator [Anaerolineales bacterium]|nr:MarR family transcriptional regulator [Anaerolineales bacterium]